jgi:subtilisin family serine protease
MHKALGPNLMPHLRLKILPTPYTGRYRGGGEEDHHTTMVKKVSRKRFDGHFSDFTTDTENYIAGPEHMVFVHNTSVVASLLGGPVESDYGTLHGIAPDARATVVQVLDKEGKARPSDILRGFDAVDIDNYLGLGMSFGRQGDCGGDCITCDAVKTLLAQGRVAFAIASTGNGGPNSLHCPGSTSEVIGVGSRRIDVNFRDEGMLLEEGVVAGFTSTGRTLEGHLKPDLYASGGSGTGTPDQWIMVNTSGVLAELNGPVAALRGTSFSAPLVLGMLALLDQAGVSKERIRAQAFAGRGPATVAKAQEKGGASPE